MTDGSRGFPTVAPMLSSEDCGAAAEWLVRVFGFSEEERSAGDDGRVTHVTLRLGDDGVVMLGYPSPDYRGPRRHAEECEQARKWREPGYVVDGVFAYVDDVDAHCRHARAAGATILSEPEDQPWGDRHYRVEDLDGHRWMFASRVASPSASD